MSVSHFCILLILTLTSYREIHGGSGNLDLFSEDSSDKRIVVWSKEIPNIKQCARLCAYMKLCSSWNYTSETEQCVIFATATSKQQSIMEENKTKLKVLSSSHPCSSEPCEVNQMCVTVSAALDFRCLEIGIDCGRPETFPNITNVFDGTTLGSSVNYTCDVGYNFTGDSNTATCGPSAEWEGFQGKCNIIDCGVPDPVDNGNITYSDTTYGSTATYICDTGYNFTGTNNTTRCKESGQWAAFSGHCEILDCGEPGPLNNGNMTYTDTTYGSVATVICDVGHNFTGTVNTVHFNKNAQWTNLIGNCKILDCGEPGPLNNGNMTYTDTTYGSVATVICDIGHNFTGTVNTVHCNKNAQWTDLTGNCKIVDCGVPSINHSSSQYTTKTYQSTVTYTCDAEYSFTGTTLTSTCTETGTWVGLDGECVATYINIAKGKTATQASTYSSSIAQKALDGACADTTHGSNQWWKVDLGENYKILKMSHMIRTDCCAHRMTSLSHNVRPDCNSCGSSTCTKTSGQFVTGSVFNYDCPDTGTGFRYVTFQLSGYSDGMTMCDVKVIIKNPLL